VVPRHLLDRAGLEADEGHGGAVTLSERIGSAANRNMHLHCLVQVTVLCGKRPNGPALTENEKTVMRYAAKITAAQIAEAETNDTPPPRRLACPMVVRDEDILVRF
jgi:hypothetical protein